MYSATRSALLPMWSLGRDTRCRGPVETTIEGFPAVSLAVAGRHDNRDGRTTGDGSVIMPSSHSGDEGMEDPLGVGGVQRRRLVPEAVEVCMERRHRSPAILHLSRMDLAED